MNLDWNDHLDSLAAGRMLRVVNFHNTPSTQRDNYARQFDALAKRFAPVGDASLDQIFDNGSRASDRPGVILAFYEGYRDHFDVAAPLLDEFGLVGWFFVPTAFLDVPAQDQVEYARDRYLGIVPDEYADGRHAMTWDELASIGKRHVVASHTANHVSAASIATADDIEREVSAPARRLAEVLGRQPAHFAWLFGQAFGSNPIADDALRTAGFRYIFSNTRIQRIA